LLLVLASYSGCSLFSFALLSLTRSFYSPYIVIGFALRSWAVLVPALYSFFFYLGFLAFGWGQFIFHTYSISGLLSLSFARRKAVIPPAPVIPPTPIVPPATTITSTALVPVIRFPVIRHTSRRNTALTLESIATFANTYSTTNGAKLLHALYSSNRGVVNSVLIFSTPSEQLYPFDLMVHSNEFLAA